LLDKALTDTRPRVSAESAEGGELGDFYAHRLPGFPGTADNCGSVSPIA